MSRNTETRRHSLLRGAAAALADSKLSAAVSAVPKPERIVWLVRHHDRPIRVLKDKDLHRNIAYVEPHNEVHYSSLFQGAAGKRLHAKAIDFLRGDHSELLISGDDNTRVLNAQLS